MMNDPQDRQPEVADLILSFSRLVRGEAELAMAEIRQNLRRMVLGAVMVLVAVLLVLVALNLLAGALIVAAVMLGVSAPWAPVTVAAGVLLVALLLAWWGISVLRPSRLVPVKAAARMRRDAETLKEMMRHDT